MERHSSLLVASVVWALLGSATACTGSSIGDPCEPESIPEGGFDAREIYIETSSVQCRTRTCMVYRLQGDPSGLPATDPARNQIFCSCRCSVATGSQANTPLCACPRGFECVDDIVTGGGEGVRGGYCVPCRYAGDPRGLSADVFEACRMP